MNNVLCRSVIDWVILNLVLVPQLSEGVDYKFSLFLFPLSVGQTTNLKDKERRSKEVPKRGIGQGGLAFG